MTTIQFYGLLLIVLLAGCNATPGPATVATKPTVQKSAVAPTKASSPVAVVAKAAPSKTEKAAIEDWVVERPNPALAAKAAAEKEQKLTQVVAQPPAPKKEPKWKPTVAPQPPRPNFAPAATKFDFVPGPVGDLLKKEIGEGAPAQLAAPRGSASPQRTGISPAVQMAEKVVLPLPTSAYAYEAALKPVERSKLPPTHPARDLPAFALNREPAAPIGAVMPIGALAVGQIPPVPSTLIAAKSVEGKPTPPVDPTRQPAFAATIKIAGADVIGPAPFQKITSPNPFERGEEVRLRSEPPDTETPGLLATKIVERAVMPVPMPEPPKK